MELLPEATLHLLKIFSSTRQIFLSEQKNVLLLDRVLKKIITKHNHLTPRKIEETLKFFGTLLPNFISFHKISNICYMQILRDKVNETKFLQKLVHKKIHIHIEVNCKL